MKQFRGICEAARLFWGSITGGHIAMFSNEILLAKTGCGNHTLRWCHKMCSRASYRSPETGHVSSFSSFSPLNRPVVLRNRFQKSRKKSLPGLHWRALGITPWTYTTKSGQEIEMPCSLDTQFLHASGLRFRDFSPAMSRNRRSGLRFQWQGGQRLSKKLETAR